MGPMRAIGMHMASHMIYASIKLTHSVRRRRYNNSYRGLRPFFSTADPPSLLQLCQKCSGRLPSVGTFRKSCHMDMSWYYIHPWLWHGGFFRWFVTWGSGTAFPSLANATSWPEMSSCNEFKSNPPTNLNRQVPLQGFKHCMQQVLLHLHFCCADIRALEASKSSSYSLDSQKPKQQQLVAPREEPALQLMEAAST